MVDSVKSGRQITADIERPLRFRSFYVNICCCYKALTDLYSDAGLAVRCLITHNASVLQFGGSLSS